MKLLHNSILFLSIFLLSLFQTAAQAQQGQLIQGIWLGKLQIKNDVHMNIAFEISNNESQQLQAVLHSLDQNVYDIPVDEVQFDGSQLILQVKALNATYKGTLLNATSIQGGLAQNSTDAFPMNMKKVGKLPVAKSRRPQEPTEPLPYLSEEVSYRNETANVTLSGTLTIPDTAGLHPVVLLISGSGPNDRNQTIFGHKVFLVLSDMLTRAGYAVLRTDDRGVNKSTGDFASASIADLASDAVAAVNYLKSRPEIDKSRIGLIGHSLGAEIAPIAANRAADVAFVVLLSGTAVESVHTAYYEQARAHYQSIGVSPTGIAVNEKVLKAVFETIRSEKDDAKAISKIAARFKKLDSEVAKLSPEERKLLELPTPLNPNQFADFLTPAYREDLFYNTASEIQKLKCPVLAINGSKDLQVLSVNLKRIERALQEGGNKHYTIKEFENKNHLFQTTSTGLISEYNNLEETFAPDVVEYMVNWMNSL
ncbi:alpha/beta hydrolase family protein [Pontibacter fetidus]|uniref:Alpha/beta hydrolase n=1 Tax=Pontibacter fetidus TaxID=2700082 RepID=A0A6B2H076_9BACT|nr:alpha/beta hydrolase [Pontibacter fetidus]NDK55731.1 alpha/beta hydrolase [Pontibacter fetidus]